MTSHHRTAVGGGWSVIVVRDEAGWRVEDASCAAQGTVLKIVPPLPVALRRYDSPETAVEAGRNWLDQERQF